MSVPEPEFSLLHAVALIGGMIYMSQAFLITWPLRESRYNKWRAGFDWEVDWDELSINRKRDIWKPLLWLVALVIFALAHILSLLIAPLVEAYLWWREFPA